MNILSNKAILTRISVFLGALLVFILVGLYFTNKFLKEAEMDSSNASELQLDASVTLTGKVTYIDPRTYPADNISFYLADTSGKKIILLYSSDDKLSVVEGLTLDVKGTKYKSKDGTNDILRVEEIIVNGTN